jgi:hypothetical protein
VIRRSLIGAAAVVLVVLVARSLAYAAEPGASARFLQHGAGSPAVPTFALAALALGAALAIAVCWLAALAVGERALLERRVAQPFAVARTLVVALALTVVASVVGGLLEAIIHWRAGLGWHGLHCLIGPVHRDLLPLEAGLSFVAAALMAAARHIGAWMRRTFAELAAQLPAFAFVETLVCGGEVTLRAAASVGAPSARAPPALG